MRKGQRIVEKDKLDLKVSLLNGCPIEAFGHDDKTLEPQNVIPEIFQSLSKDRESTLYKKWAQGTLFAKQPKEKQCIEMRK